MERYKIAVLAPKDYEKSERGEDLINFALDENDIDLIFIDGDSSIEEIVSNCYGIKSIITQGVYKYITELASNLDSLKLIQTPSAGTDWLDKSELSELGVSVSNNGGGNAVAVAEHAIALMFAIYRKLDLQIENLKKGNYQDFAVPDLMDNIAFANKNTNNKSYTPGTWNRNEYHTLVGKRVGIVGMGRIGSRVAKRLAGWECELVYNDVLNFPDNHTNATKVSMDELLSTSDIITLHVPLERTTHHMISYDEFNMMKSNTILINTSRGPVVDETELIQALKEKKIFGAGLDVTEIEPIDMNNPLLLLENVILTPHFATRAYESEINIASFAVRNASKVARGDNPDSVVPPV
jgi:phosphoglycerate dehydrogenase-like enzyme